MQKKQHPSGNRKGLGGSRRSTGGPSGRPNKDDHAKSSRPSARRTSDDPRRSDDNRRQERPYDSRQGAPYKASGRPQLRRTSDDPRPNDDNRRQERPYDSRQGAPYKASGRPQLRRTSDDPRRSDNNRRQDRPYNSRQGTPYKASGRPQLRRTSDDPRRNDDNRRQDRPYDSRQGTPYKAGGRPQLRRTSDDPRRSDDNRRQERPYGNRQNAAFKGGRPPHKANRPSPWKTNTKSNAKSSLAYDESIRLNKYIANAGICSRREADVLIATGAISINGKVVTELGTKVMPEDVIKYGDQRLVNEKKVYLLLNKPKDFITTSDDPQERRTVFDLIKSACKERIYPVGRLDRNTTGILLFTNDGELTKRLTHPKHGVRKLYHVHLDKALTKADAESIMQGVQIDGTLVVPDSMEYTGKDNTKNEIGIEIHSGQNRVVRRLFEKFGYNVVKLDRVVFAGLTKKDLPRGKWRFLSEKEVSFLKMLG